MKVDFTLAGNICNPVNRQEISIQVNHDQESVINQPRPHVGISNLYFSDEDIKMILSLLATSPGITEGVPFNINISERGITATIQMYVNAMDGFKRSREGIVASLKMRDSLDWLDDKLDGFTLESMYNEVGIPSFYIDGIKYNSYQEYFDKRCVFIPYVISTIPNFRDAFMALFSVTFIIIELNNSFKTVIQWATPVLGVMPSVNVFQLIDELLFIVLLIAAIISLISHLFNCLIQSVKYHGAMLLTDMLKIVCKKIGKELTSSIWDSYPYNQIAYLPEKYNPIEEQNPAINTIFGITFGGFAKSGFTSPGYATSAVHDSFTSTIQKGYITGTGKDVFYIAKKLCNGKIIIENGTNNLIFERRDYYPSNSTYQLPDIRQDWNGFNTDELSANIIIEFENDLNDKNSMDKFTGSILQAVHSQIITNDQAMVMLKGIRKIQLGVARGVRKEDLNFIEKMHRDLYVPIKFIIDTGTIAIDAAIIIVDALIIVIDTLIVVWNLLMAIIKTIITIIDDIIKIVGGHSPGKFKGYNLLKNTVPLIKLKPLQALTQTSYTDRIDALLLENDMVSMPKLLLVDTSRSEFTGTGGYSGQKRIAYLHKDNDKVINAQYLWDKFYFIDSFVGKYHNRLTKISPALNKDSDKNPITMSLADFNSVVSNPKINDNFGEEIIVDSIDWRIGDESGKAVIDFRKRGWLLDPQNNDGTKRAKEININLQINTSTPNGQ